MNLEHCRKDAKVLRRGVAAGEDRALVRAAAVLGELGAAGRERRVDAAVDTGLRYRPGDPVRVHVIHRPNRTTVTDDGGALERAGVVLPWRDLADLLERELDVNVSRTGAVWLPVVRVGPGEDTIVERIGRASLAFYEDLLELE